ncbi:Hypothetical predicted protein [Cloeon dipterum]|uniref:Uncharacterized protein n=1 Tax=Cloeon dipterum TaxID=197152 RepID=A0A8S1C4R4_9INSE|nr:Hypothetical predicted protein [Cloeon dipterum]
MCVSKPADSLPRFCGSVLARKKWFRGRAHNAWLLFKKEKNEGVVLPLTAPAGRSSKPPRPGSRPSNALILTLTGRPWDPTLMKRLPLIDVKEFSPEKLCQFTFSTTCPNDSKTNVRDGLQLIQLQT